MVNEDSETVTPAVSFSMMVTATLNAGALS